MKTSTIIIGGLAGAYFLMKLAEAKDTCSNVVDISGGYILDAPPEYQQIPAAISHIGGIMIINKTDNIISLSPRELEIPELRIHFNIPPESGWITLDTMMGFPISIIGVPEDIRNKLLTKEEITLNVKKFKYKLRFHDFSERECIFSGKLTFRIGEGS